MVVKKCRINFRVSEKTLKQFTAYCRTKNVAASTLLDQAVRLYTNIGDQANCWSDLASTYTMPPDVHELNNPALESRFLLNRLYLRTTAKTQIDTPVVQAIIADVVNIREMYGKALAALAEKEWNSAALQQENRGQQAHHSDAKQTNAAQTAQPIQPTQHNVAPLDDNLTDLLAQLGDVDSSPEDTDSDDDADLYDL